LTPDEPISGFLRWIENDGSTSSDYFGAILDNPLSPDIIEGTPERHQRIKQDDEFRNKEWDRIILENIDSIEKNIKYD
jgi:hypothetical protein